MFSLIQANRDIEPGSSGNRPACVARHGPDRLREPDVSTILDEQRHNLKMPELLDQLDDSSTGEVELPRNRRRFIVIPAAMSSRDARQQAVIAVAVVLDIHIGSVCQQQSHKIRIAQPGRSYQRCQQIVYLEALGAHSDAIVIIVERTLNRRQVHLLKLAAHAAREQSLDDDRVLSIDGCAEGSGA